LFNVAVVPKFKQIFFQNQKASEPGLEFCKSIPLWTEWWSIQ